MGRLVVVGERKSPGGRGDAARRGKALSLLSIEIARNYPISIIIIIIFLFDITVIQRRFMGRSVHSCILCPLVRLGREGGEEGGVAEKEGSVGDLGGGQGGSALGLLLRLELYRGGGSPVATRGCAVV